MLSVNGLYDLATPFHGAEYEFQHMALEPQLRQNIRYTYYPAGHMMYIDPPSARQLKADLAAFYASALIAKEKGRRIAPPALPPP